MKLSQRGVDLIKEFEGYHRQLPDGSCVAYRCPAGVWTLGYGCTEGIKEGMRWTKADAEARLRAELEKHERVVDRLSTVDLNQNQYDALVSFSYNLGSGALGKSTLLAKVNKGDTQAAGQEFGKWIKAGGKVLPGLVARRGKEAALFLEPMQDAADPAMPQRLDPPVVAAPGPLPRSGTLWGGLTGIGATCAAYFDNAVKGALEAVQHLTELAPIKSLAVEAGANVKALTLGFGVFACLLVILRRVKAHVEGKLG